MKKLITIGCALGVALGACGETTPLNMLLEEQKEILITCELAQAPKRAEVPVLSAKDCEAVKGTYHYKLWLPAGYLADKQKAWPCLFIASPGGKAGMGQMAAWIKASGYVAIMLVESKNGPWAPIAGNFLAAHDDVIKRVRIQEGLKLATGMSGGARAASLFVQMRPGFAGLVLQAAGGASDDKGQYHVSKLKGSPGVVVAMTMGEKDPNKTEVARMKAAVGASRFNAFPFDGPHGWAPQETFEKAINWVEQQIYRRSDTAAAVKKLLAPRCAAAGK
jgi:hypothetical protein